MNNITNNNSINRNLLFLLLILGSILLLYFCTCKKQKGGQSNGNTNGNTNSNTNSIFVLYYVDWCPHCQVVKPQWDKLEKDNELNIEIKKINCEENPTIAEEKEIEGFPTIQLEHSNGEVKSYDGERTYRGFKEFLNKD